MNLNKLTGLIQLWSMDRGLHLALPEKQMLKLSEEVGELAQAIAKNKSEEEIKEEIGDIYVVITILSQQYGFDVKDCIETAYKKISDRQGEMINGVFVKESDLR